MGLSTELISQFAKIVNPDTDSAPDPTIYGTAVEHNGIMYVRLDGSEQLTPISSTATAKAGERVMVTIKNHTATVTGNMSSPAARSEDMSDAMNEITKLEIAIAYRVTTEDLQATSAIINSLKATVARLDEATLVEAKIEELEAMYANLVYVSAEEVNALNAEIESIKSIFGEFTSITTEDLDAVNADLDNLQAYNAEFTYVSADILKTTIALVKELDAEKLDADEASITYATIDFSNISQAAMEYLYSKSGLIENVIVGDGTITGVLAGVTIRGDMIEANTVVADKLVIKGEDGLYYKLNTDGVTTEAEQTEYNSLNGQVILAKSITATQISVDDLVAFDATIGGFSITDDAIFSNVKDSEGNTTRGTYLGADGQVNFGDADKFLKYYQDESGVWRLTISADTILYDLDGSPHSLADLGAIGEYVKIGTYEGEPCIELGETDSDFKLLITNTRMLFMEGTNVIAHISNQSLHIKKAVIEEELQQGGFIWKIRANGNLGLMWKGVSS